MICIVTDLDNTLVGNVAATQEFNRNVLSLGAMVRLVYATGRSMHSARQLQVTADLLEPHYWITGVGSEIYQGTTIDGNWSDHLSYQWNRPVLWTIATQVSKEFPALIPQPEDTSNQHKISFYLYGESTEKVMSIVKSRIAESGFAAQVIYSSHEDVDILPIRCDKGLAMRYVIEKMGFDNTNTIVCGDSGNDIGLFKQNTLGIVVGNARSELLNWCREFGAETVFFAQSDCAAGILEGLSHFGAVKSFI